MHSVASVTDSTLRKGATRDTRELCGRDQPRTTISRIVWRSSLSGAIPQFIVERFVLWVLHLGIMPITEQLDAQIFP
jgi:hypothetical protein